MTWNVTYVCKFAMLYCNILSSSSRTNDMVLSSFSSPFVNSFLIIASCFLLPASISQAICEQRMFVCTCMFEFKIYWFVTSMEINKLQGYPTTVFCKISVRRSKYRLEFCITWGQLKISGWPFHSCTAFEAYLKNSLRFSEVQCFTFHTPG